MSAFALGNFAGPTVAGLVVQFMGFPKTTLIFFILYCVMLAVDLVLVSLLYHLCKIMRVKKLRHFHSQAISQAVDARHSREYEQLD